MSFLHRHEISAPFSKHLEAWLQYCVGDVLISNIVLAVTEDPCCSAYSQHCVTLTFSKGPPPHVWVLLSLVLSTVTCIFAPLVFFAGVFSGLLGFGYLFTCQSSSLSLQMWGFRSECSTMPSPPHLPYFSLLTIPSFLPSLPFLFLVCLHFDQFLLI